MCIIEASNAHRHCVKLNLLLFLLTRCIYLQTNNNAFKTCIQLFRFRIRDIQRLRYKFCRLRVWKTIYPPLWIEILQNLYSTIHSFHIQLFSHTKMVLCHVGKLCFRQFNTACFTFRISMCHFYELFHHIPIKPTSGLKCWKLLSIAS